MARATSSLRVGTRRRPAPRGRRLAGSLGHGVAMVAIGLATVTGALTAGGWLLSIAVDARSDRQSTIGLAPQSRLAWLALPGTAIAATAPYVMRNWPDEDDKSDITGSVGPRVAALPASGVLGDTNHHHIYLGPTGRHAFQFESRPLASTGRFERVVRLQDRPAIIPPKARQQLAALPPATGIKIPDDDPQLAKTAIYDIAAKAVYLPNGEKLEAHSGLGQYMDDPKHVKLRMRGVTPPNTYRLTMREALFHGVEAIRMNPEDRDGMFGRNGILVHSYMLGPSGQSNGCVSVKDYPKFLAAFKRGEVERMVVVFRLPEPPAAYARRNSRTARAM